MKLTTYDQKYENDVVALWNQELPEDPITVHKFRHQALLDDNFDSDLCYVALEMKKLLVFFLPHVANFLIWNGEQNLTEAGSMSCLSQRNGSEKASEA